MHGFFSVPHSNYGEAHAVFRMSELPKETPQHAGHDPPWNDSKGIESGLNSLGIARPARLDIFFFKRQSQPRVMIGVKSPTLP